MFKQIACALEALEEHGVVHHDVSEYTIIIEHVSGRYKAYLTGFSEFDIEMGQTRGLDLSCLASTIMGRLPTQAERRCCDPAFRSLLDRSIQKNVSASQVCRSVEDFAAEYAGCPFKTLWITKEMSIKRIVDGNNAEGLRLLDLLRIVLHYDAKDVKPMEKLIKKVIRRERLFLLGDETYCYLEDAQRLLHHLKTQSLSLMLDLCPPWHSEACWYETKHRIDVPISYHGPSKMVNITQVLNLLADEEARSFEDILPAIQELRGLPQWEGHYIDVESMYQVLGKLGLKMGEIQEQHPISRYAFSDNDSNHFVIVATSEMIGLIFLNRNGKTVKWNGREQTIDDAIKVCEEHGLLVAQMAIREDVTMEPEWTSRYTNEQIMNLFGGECMSEATEHNSFLISDSLQFTLKKRKGHEDVPTLPAMRTSFVEEATLRDESPWEKCETWVSDKDIRPTRFKGKQTLYR